MSASFFSWPSNYADRDLEEYRAGYPKRKDDPNANANVLFFRNEIPMLPERATIQEVLEQWRGNYGHLEMCHSYIQWLFPIQERGLNYQAQELMKHEIPVMRNDPAIRERVVAVFDLMLDFYGMTLNKETGEIRRAEAYRPQYRNLNVSSHNYLRITRMLKFLGEMGREDLKINWLRFFADEIFATRELHGCERSFINYWSGTLYEADQRQALKDYVSKIVADSKKAH